MRSASTANSLRRLTFLNLLSNVRDWLLRSLRLINRQVRKDRKQRLRIAESISLGDKRFIALVEVGEQQLLIGGTPQSVNVLSRLRQVPPTEFARTLRRCERWVM